MISLAVAGAAGRMGQRIIALAGEDARFDVLAALEKTGHPRIGDRLGDLPVQDHTETEVNVLIDFTLPDGTMHWLEFCLAGKIPMVIGTTGHTPQQVATIEEAARTIPILKATNMSVGVNLMFKLAGEMAAALGDEYDIEIVEAHHRFKIDAPSGTANSIRDAILDATGRDAARDVVYGRQGEAGKRPPRQIGMHSLRIGDTVGEHEVHFGNLGETMVLRHTAHTRDTFAAGALRAAHWLSDKPAGKLYSMLDALGMA